MTDRYFDHRLSTAEKQQRLDSLVAGLDERVARFGEVLDAAGGPAEFVAGSDEGLVAMWCWFTSTYIVDRRSPIADSGVAFERVAWVAAYPPPERQAVHPPIVVPEETWAVVGGMADVLSLMLVREFGPTVLRLGDVDMSPVVGELHATPWAAAKVLAMTAARCWGSEPRNEKEAAALGDRALIWSLHRAQDAARTFVQGGPTAPSKLEPPRIFVGGSGPDVETAIGEFEISLDERVTWELRERFCLALVHGNSKLRIDADAGDRHTVLIRCQWNALAVTAAVDQAWWPLTFVPSIP